MRHRRHRPAGQGRRVRVEVTFDAGEVAAIRGAAVAAGLTTSGYVAAVAVAAAGEAPPPLPVPLRDALAEASDLATQLRRAATNLNQAVAQGHATGEPPVWLADAVRRTMAAVERVDGVCDRIGRTLP